MRPEKVPGTVAAGSVGTGQGTGSHGAKRLPEALPRSVPGTVGNRRRGTTGTGTPSLDGNRARSRETLEDKGQRLLSTGAVMVLFADELHIVARVRGDAGVYDTEWSRWSGWSCTCPNLHRCSHQAAVASVTTKPLLHAVVGGGAP